MHKNGGHVRPSSACPAHEIKQGSNFISSENLFVSTTSQSHTNQQHSHTHPLSISLSDDHHKDGANNGRVLIVYFCCTLIVRNQIMQKEPTEEEEEEGVRAYE